MPLAESSDSDSTYSVEVMRSIDANAFQRLAKRVTWTKGDRHFLEHIIGVNLDPALTRNIGKRVERHLSGLGPSNAMTLGVILARPLLETLDAYGLGPGNKVNLERIRAQLPTILHDHGIERVRIWLAHFADGGMHEPRSGEAGEYDRRVARRCQILLADEEFALPEWSDWPVPTMTAEEEALDEHVDLRPTPEPVTVSASSNTPSVPEVSEEPDAAAESPSETALDRYRLAGWRSASDALHERADELAAMLDAAKVEVMNGRLPSGEAERLRVALAAETAALLEDVATVMAAEGHAGPEPKDLETLLPTLDAAERLLEAREAAASEASSLAKRLDDQARRIAILLDALPATEGFTGSAAELLSGLIAQLRRPEPWQDEDDAAVRALEHVAEAHAAARAGDMASLLRLGRDRSIPDDLHVLLEQAAELNRWNGRDVGEPGSDGEADAIDAGDAEGELQDGDSADDGVGAVDGEDAEAGEGVYESESDSSATDDVATIAVATPSPVDGNTADDPIDSDSSEFADGSDLPGMEHVLGSFAAGSLGLAHWFAQTAGWTAPRSRVLAAAAYAGAIRTPNGPAAAGYQRSVSDFRLQGLEDNRGLQILAFSAAVRAALVAPYRGASDVLGELEGSIGAQSARSLVGLLRSHEGVPLPTSGEDADGDDVESVRQRIADAALKAQEDLVRLRERTTKYQRASEVWREWLKEGGLLGAPLRIVADDRRGAVAEVAEVVANLSDPRTVDGELSTTDERLAGRQRARRPIEGQPLQWIARNVEDVVRLLRDWTESVRTLERISTSGPGRDARVENLRGQLRGLAGPISGWLDGQFDQAEQEGRAFRQRCIDAARTMMAESFDLAVDGVALVGREPGDVDVLEREILKAPAVPFSEFRERFLAETLEGWLRTEDVAEALTTTYETAFARRLAAGEHLAAQLILEEMSLLGHDVDDLRRLEDDLLDRREEASQHLDTLLRECEDHLARARQEQHFPVEGTAAEQAEGRLLQLREDVVRLGAEGNHPIARAAVDAFHAHLDGVLAASQSEMLEHLTEWGTRNPALKAEVGRIREVIDAGRLETARELMRLGDQGMPLPDRIDAVDPLAPLTRLVEEVLPALERNTPKASLVLQSITDRSRPSSTLPVDFSVLSEEAVDRAQRGLSAWYRLMEAEAAGGGIRKSGTLVDEVRSLLQFIGLLGQFRVTASKGGNERTATWFDVEGSRVSGEVRTHQYGSSADGRYSVVVITHRPDAKAVSERIAARLGDEPVIVLYLGVMRLEDRRRLAEEARRNNHRPAVVIDLAVLLMLASDSSGFHDTLALTLPFSWLDPYLPFANAHVPEEVFVGRDEELRDIVGTGGTHFIFGGRQLGKSALLKAAQRSFESLGDARVSIYLDVKARLGGFDDAWQVVRVVAERVQAAGIPVAKSTVEQQPEALRAALFAWLKEDDKRRLLILLDEVDEFLDADAPKFAVVDFFKSLYQDTDRRVKPVFAGLQSVQRFMALENNPFPHLGRHIQIGPLAPRPAADLVAMPLAALGLRFEDGLALARFLGRTNYHPGLIQIYCGTLVRHMSAKRLQFDQPPQTITSEVLDRVFEDRDLIELVRERFVLTIDLDNRYRVIAYSMALRALDGGFETAATVDEVLEACLSWWPAGFSRRDRSEFESLLQEMVGLGVLSVPRDGRRYSMRSPNVISLLGDREQIEQVLLEAEEKRPQRQALLGVYRALYRDRRLPLSEQAMRDVIARDRDQLKSPVRVLLGSRATSSDIILEAVRESVKFYGLGACKKLQVSKVPGAIRKVGDGEPRVHVLVDLFDAEGEAVLAAVESIRSEIGDRQNVAVIALVGPDGLAAWQDLVDASSEIGGPGVTLLSRMSDASIQAWGVRIDRPLDDARTIAQVRESTGGWPILIDDLYARSTTGIAWTQALEEVGRTCEDAVLAADFVAKVGLHRSSQRGVVFDHIVQLGMSIAFDELVGYLGSLDELAGEEVAGMLRDLIALQVLDETQVPTKGGTGAVSHIAPEPFFAKAWSVGR